MKNQFLVFKFDSRNTGYYVEQDLNILTARNIAKKFDKSQVEGNNGFFELYENGQLTEWSAVGHI